MLDAINIILGWKFSKTEKFYDNASGKANKQHGPIFAPYKDGGLTLQQKTHNGYMAAFTLAEVLITLGIIGVVAAMTLPSLIAN